MNNQHLDFDPYRYRANFPIFDRKIHGKPLVYLDSANTAQRPQCVIAAVDDYYRKHNANISRSVHTLSAEATLMYEQTRDRLQAFVNAERREEIVLTRGTTEAINLVAYSWGLRNLKTGDVVLLSMMEHHANIVPWQIVAALTGAKIKSIPISIDGEILLDEYEKLLADRVKLVGITHASNVLGTVNPLNAMIRSARAHGVLVLVDGSQAAPHFPIDVRQIQPDFYAFTGHKMFAPTGTGALWARHELLAAMPPFMGGGEMIEQVSFEKTTYADPPQRFEAGTPNIAGMIGFGKAVAYVEEIGFKTIMTHEERLTRHLLAQLAELPGVRIFGKAKNRIGVVSFLLEGAHAHDVATLLDLEGIAVRSGHHCAHPLMKFYGVPATTRVSLSLYNTLDEIDHFIRALQRAQQQLT